jgi:hypothetical protein
MRRRKFIALLGGTVATRSILWPLPARAQQARVPLFGFLAAPSAESYGHMRIPFARD